MVDDYSRYSKDDASGGIGESPAPARSSVLRREWRAVGLFALVVMLVTTLPYLVGAAQQSETRRFGWFVFGADDANSYLAKMRAGALATDWLIPLLYTAEPHAPALIFVPYVALGKLTSLFVSPHDPAFVDAMLIAFHTARLVFGSLLILITYRLVAVFVRKRGLRWLALTLITLGGGLGWLLTALGLGNWLGTIPVDFMLPEGYTFFLLYGLPHLSLARIGLLGGLLALFRAQASTRRWLPWAALAALCWLIMGLCVPFYVGVLGVILGAWGVVALIRQRQFPMALLVRCAVAAALPAAFLAFNLYQFSANPVLSAFQGQNILPSPHPLHYVAGYGLLIALAVPAFGWAWRRGAREIRLLLPAAWLVAGPFLAYAPIGVQRRLLEGIFVPLCIFAVIGLRVWWLRLARRSRRIWYAAVAGVLFASLCTPLLIMAGGALHLALFADTDDVFFHTAEQIAALDWLNAAVPAGSVVLSRPGIGTYAPVRANVRAYIGHDVETIESGPKQSLVERFFSNRLNAAERAALLSQVHYVIADPSEPLLILPELWLIYERGYRIYKVVH